MGLFLDLTGIVGQPKDAVIIGLKNYLKIFKGDIEPAEINVGDKNFCTVYEENGNTTIFYPAYFFKTDECSAFLSKELNAPVFSFHIYDGDFWTYTLFVNGGTKDKFMPIPDYFDLNVRPAEIDSWKGDAEILARYVPGLEPEDIERYLVRWDLEQEETKAYEDDEFTYCEDQLFDFMRKLKISYPMDDDDNPKGIVYRFWSKDIPLAAPITDKPEIEQKLRKTSKDKQWWKFW